MRTIFESHLEDGVSAIAISQDAKYLATISAGTVQVKIKISSSVALRDRSLEVFPQCSQGEGGDSDGESRREVEQVCRVMAWFC